MKKVLLCPSSAIDQTWVRALRVLHLQCFCSAAVGPLFFFWIFRRSLQISIGASPSATVGRQAAEGEGVGATSLLLVRCPSAASSTRGVKAPIIICSKRWTEPVQEACLASRQHGSQTSTTRYVSPQDQQISNCRSQEVQPGLWWHGIRTLLELWNVRPSYVSCLYTSCVFWFFFQSIFLSFVVCMFNLFVPPVRPVTTDGSINLLSRFQWTVLLWRVHFSWHLINKVSGFAYLLPFFCHSKLSLKKYDTSPIVCMVAMWSEKVSFGSLPQLKLPRQTLHQSTLQE